jgi:hypothetical protein
MTHYESAIDEIAGRLQGTDASLTSSIADILAAAMQELIEAELTATIGAEHGADWVLNADVDEFYWPEVGPDLRTIFAAVPEQWGVIELPVCHFLAPAEQGGFFADSMTVREVRSLKPSGKSHLVKVAHRGRADVKVSRGGHRGSLEVPEGLTLNGAAITSGAQVAQVLRVGTRVMLAPDAALPFWARLGNEGLRDEV